MSITVNPSDKEIDIDLSKADKIMVFHNCKRIIDFEKVMEETVDFEKNELIYIHLYPKEDVYTIGLKARDWDVKRPWILLIDAYCNSLISFNLNFDFN